MADTGTGDGCSVSSLASTLAHSYLDPLSFFVSWQGVLTLAYEGFSPALAQYKCSLNSSCPELPRENPGSKWPKTTLGALKNEKRLTPQDLSALMNVCRSFEGILARVAERVLIKHLTLVTYKCRSLEKCIERTRICLSRHKHVDQSRASQSEQDNVQAVLQEADQPSYWVMASKDGNRESHYRGVALGCTLVADLFTPVNNFDEGKGDLIAILDALEDNNAGCKGEEDASVLFTKLTPAILGQPPYCFDIRRCNLVKKAMKYAQGLPQSSGKKDSSVGTSDAVILEGKIVQIQLKGDSETVRVPMQRNLFRRQEDEEMLFMPDGLPAGRLWLNDIDDLVEPSRAAIRVLHNPKGAHQGCPQVPGKTPNGLSTELYPVGSTIEVSPFVDQLMPSSTLTPVLR